MFARPVAPGGPAAFGDHRVGETWERDILVVRYDVEDRVERIGFRTCRSLESGGETIGECVRDRVEEGGVVIPGTGTGQVPLSV